MTQPNPLQPHTYPRRILLAVAANSPQIVTETLYALAHRSDPPWLPTAIHVITTQGGLKHVRAGLCADAANQLGKLCQDYALPMPCFCEAHIHLITDADGKVLDDVRTATDNSHAADFISRIVRQFTADEHCSLHVSLSGGRRTMTYYIGYALSLFGRVQDRLSHVVVDSEYFFNVDFFYPPPRSVWVVRNDGTGFDASIVEVTLAEIPFLRLREGLPAPLLQGNASFSETITATQQHFNPPEVILNWQQASLTCGGIAITMPPIQFAFYVWMLQRCLHNQPPIHWTDQEETPFEQQFLKIYQQLFGTNGNYEVIKRTLSKGMSKAWLEERKSHINKILTQLLGTARAQDYLLHSHGKRPRMRIGIRLPVQALQIR